MEHHVPPGILHSQMIWQVGQIPAHCWRAAWELLQARAAGKYRLLRVEDNCARRENPKISCAE